jgi:tape measure domain-containing protein
MATTNRDVELALRVTTLGADGIAKLEQSIRTLAEEGGAAAPEFQQLADQVARLGQNASQLDTFSRLGRDVRDLSDAQNVASETAGVLYTQLENLTAATGAFEQAENAAKTALRAAQDDLANKKAALALLRAETDAAAKKETEYTDAVRTARVEIINAETGVRALRDAYSQAKVATNEAADAQKQVATQLAAANRAAQQAATATREANVAYDEVKGTLAAAGVATESLETAQLALIDALNLSGEAARNLVIEQQNIIEAERAAAAEEQRLADIVYRSRLAAQDAARVEADHIVADFERMQAAEQAAAKQAAEAASVISSAFKTLSTTTVAELRAELDRVRAAMVTLQTTGSVTGADLDAAMRQGQARVSALERDIRAATGELTIMDRVSGALKSTMGQLAGAFGIVQVVQQLGREFFETNKQMDALRLGFTTIYGSSQIAAQQIDFLRKVAQQSGLSISAISESFVKFSASTKQANIPLAQSNDLFLAVNRAAGTLGLSGERVTLILDALAQMAAKGTVSMEELRRQLGDSLPGALGLTAKGLGITEAQLYALVTSGNLLARDLFPALTSSLGTMSGEVDTLNSKWERFKNTLTIASQTAGDSGWTNVLKGGITTLGFALGAVVILFQSFIEVVFGVVKAGAVLIGALTTWTNPLEELGKIVEGATSRINNLGHAFGDLQGAGDKTRASQAQTATAMQATGQSAQGAATGVAVNTAALSANAAAGERTTIQQLAAATAAERAAASALVAGKSWVQLSVEYGQANTQLESAVEIAKKVANAAALEGEAIVSLTKLTGSQRQELEASTKAAEVHEAALVSLAEKHKQQVQVLQNEVTALTEVARQLGDPDGTRKKAIVELQRLLDTRAAESEKVREQLENLRNEIATRKLAQQTYEDNSGALEKLRQAMATTAQAVRDLQILEINGKATREQVVVATRAAAAAEGLYRDALKDSGAAAERNIQALQNKNLVTQAGIALDIERAKSLEALAKSNGDESLATAANVIQKELQIKASLASAKAMLEEANAAIANAEAMRAALKASGDLTVEKDAEIAKTIASAEVKKLEAERLKESTKAIEAEIQRLREGTAARTTSVDIITKETNALYDNLLARNKIAEQKTTNDGFAKNPDGSAAGTFNNALPLDQAQKLVSDTKAGNKVTDEQAKAAFDQANNAFQYMQQLAKQAPGVVSPEFVQSITALYTATKLALEKVLAQNGGGTINSGTGTPPGTGGSTDAGASGTSSGGATNHIVNVNIGGVTTPINVASASDSSALVSLLGQLANARGTAA